MTELDPEHALGLPFGAEELNQRPWSVRWDALAPGEVDTVVRRCLPAYAEFATSGSSGPPRQWRVTREQLWAEARLLAGLLGEPRPVGVLAFAPPRHRYGALCSVLLPAALRVAAHGNPTGRAALPAARPGDHWLVVAIPSAFTLLRRRAGWLRDLGSVTVLHSSARLPETAAELSAAVPDRPPRVVELLGSTETGAVATRDVPSADGRWTLVPGVDLVTPADPAAGDPGEVPLTVRSPLLGAPAGGPAPATGGVNDLVRPLGGRQFLLAGRRERLVKVNGRRHDLDEVENRFRRGLPGRELACVPVADPAVGEHFELLVTRGPDGSGPDPEELRRAVAAAGVTPRRVRAVATIARSATGKVRHAQTHTDREG